DATGLDLQFVDARTEALDALKSAVPTVRLPEAIVVDIGGGNTKLGCMVGDSFNSVEIPYGSQTLRKVAAANPNYDAGLQSAMADISQAYRTERMNTPCLGNRKIFYFMGGAAWATATFAKPEAARRSFVKLARADVSFFVKSLHDEQWNQGDPQFHFAPKTS